MLLLALILSLQAACAAAFLYVVARVFDVTESPRRSLRPDQPERG